MIKRLIVFVLSFLTLSVSAKAAIEEVKAAIDTPMVIVGMPRILHLELTVPKDARVEWPSLQRQGGIPAADMEKPEQTYMLEFGPDTDFSIDTLSSSSAQVTLAQDLMFFAFDSAAMLVKPIPFVVNGTDTLYTDVLALSCDQPFEQVPADAQAAQGMKDIMEPPFVLWDYLRWVVYTLIALLALSAIGALVYWLIKRFKKNPEEKPIVPEILKPAHVVAMDALIELEHRHLWESGQFKAFHTELTDILRRYLERRYQIQALESTTDEIMDELVELQIQQKSSYNNLHQILKLADYVKFAKYEPAADENQMSFYNARLFVEQTKEFVVEKKPGEAPEVTGSETSQTKPTDI